MPLHQVYIDDYLERHHADEHARYEKMLAHQHHPHHGGGSNSNAALLPDAVDGSSSILATGPPSYCNHDPTCQCELGKGGKGCLRQRIQCAYWSGWSHGEILFRLPTLYALDKQLRAQEHFFRTRDVEDTMNASMRPVPRRGVSGGIVQRRQSASMPQQAMRQALSAVAEAQEGGQGAGAARGQSFIQRRASRGGDREAKVGGEKEKDGVGLGVTWQPVPNEGMTLSGKKLL